MARLSSQSMEYSLTFSLESTPCIAGQTWPNLTEIKKINNEKKQKRQHDFLGLHNWRQKANPDVRELSLAVTQTKHGQGKL